MPNTFQPQLDEYMAMPIQPEKVRYAIATPHGPKEGVDPRPRFEMAVCPGCRRHVEVLPVRAVDNPERDAWKAEMVARGYRVIGDMIRQRTLEGECVCEGENVQEE